MPRKPKVKVMQTAEPKVEVADARKQLTELYRQLCVQKGFRQIHVDSYTIEQLQAVVDHCKR